MRSDKSCCLWLELQDETFAPALTTVILARPIVRVLLTPFKFPYGCQSQGITCRGQVCRSPSPITYQHSALDIHMHMRRNTFYAHLSQAAIWLLELSSCPCAAVVIVGCCHCRLLQCGLIWCRALRALWNDVWRTVAEARDVFAQGYPLVISKHGDLQYASRCWSENAAGEEIELDSTVRSHGSGGSAASTGSTRTSSTATTPATGSTWMRSFWRIGATTSTGRSYQLFSIHLASLPAAAIADTMRRLVAECRELVQCAR